MIACRWSFRRGGIGGPGPRWNSVPFRIGLLRSRRLFYSCHRVFRHCRKFRLRLVDASKVQRSGVDQECAAITLVWANPCFYWRPPNRGQYALASAYERSRRDACVPLASCLYGIRQRHIVRLTCFIRLANFRIIACFLKLDEYFECRGGWFSSVSVVWLDEMLPFGFETIYIRLGIAKLTVKLLGMHAKTMLPQINARVPGVWHKFDALLWVLM